MLAPSELTRIVQALDDAAASGIPAALATVVAVAGSAYRRPGARLFVREDGVAAGGVSGGCLEADVVRKARAAMLDRRAAVISYDTTDDQDGSFGAGQGCQGEILILVEPVGAERTSFHAACLRDMQAAREARVLALRFTGSAGDLGARALFSSAGAILAGDVPGRPQVLAAHVAAVLQQRRGSVVSLDAGESVDRLLLDYLAPAPRLFLVGAGPDSEPLAGCATALGYQVIVVDERPGTLGRRRFPRGTLTSSAPVDHVARTYVDGHTACVIATHNTAYDARALRGLLPSPARYIGVLGPRKRAARLLQQLGEGDAPRFFAPIGLDIGGETPEQIALAVLAEIQAVTLGRPGGFLRDRMAPIHDRAGELGDAGGVDA